MNAEVSQHHGIILIERVFLKLLYTSLLLKAGTKSLLQALFFQSFENFFSQDKSSNNVAKPP